MRTIKFRAWDKINKKWMNGKDFPWTYTQESTPIFSFDPQGIACMNEWDCEIIQFTGLKDKNGKEIYEGDIFQCLYAFDGCTNHVMVVEYNEPRAGFFPRWDYEKCQQKGVSKNMHDLEELKIIGNIYENPELLSH